MIRLADDKESVAAALGSIKAHECIKNTIRLYLDSYGVGYDFCRFYLHSNADSVVYSAVILIYNNYMYCTACKSADFTELEGFIAGYSEHNIIADIILYENISVLKKGEICAVMSKCGTPALKKLNSNVALCDDVMIVSELAGDGMTEQERTDFFLNTSHQLRHGAIEIYARYIDGKAVSIASVTRNNYGSVAVIPFVFTSEYFRGNGYSREVLEHITTDPDITYQLMCEGNNIKFYQKCGFTRVDSLVRLGV